MRIGNKVEKAELDAFITLSFPCEKKKEGRNALRLTLSSNFQIPVTDLKFESSKRKIDSSFFFYFFGKC